MTSRAERKRRAKERRAIFDALKRQRDAAISLAAREQQQIMKQMADIQLQLEYHSKLLYMQQQKMGNRFTNLPVWKTVPELVIEEETLY